MQSEPTDGGSQDILGIRIAQNADSRQLYEQYHAAREEEAYKRQFAQHQPHPLNHLMGQQAAPGQHAMPYGDERPRRRTIGPGQGYNYDPHQSQPMYPDHLRRHTPEQADVAMGGMEVSSGAELLGIPALEAHRELRELPPSHRAPPTSAGLHYQGSTTLTPRVALFGDCLSNRFVIDFNASIMILPATHLPIPQIP